MAKFFGKVGYAISEEIRPGVWKKRISERTYYGDIIKNISRWQSGEGINDDINITSDIKILADAFAYEHFSQIRYVEFMGAKWKVNNASPERPRITLSLGGLYNGQ